MALAIKHIHQTKEIQRTQSVSTQPEDVYTNSNYLSKNKEKMQKMRQEGNTLAHPCFSKSAKHSHLRAAHYIFWPGLFIAHTRTHKHTSGSLKVVCYSYCIVNLNCFSPPTSIILLPGCLFPSNMFKAHQK